MVKACIDLRTDLNTIEVNACACLHASLLQQQQIITLFVLIITSLIKCFHKIKTRETNLVVN